MYPAPPPSIAKISQAERNKNQHSFGSFRRKLKNRFGFEHEETDSEVGESPDSSMELDPDPKGKAREPEMDRSLVSSFFLLPSSSCLSFNHLFPFTFFSLNSLTGCFEDFMEGKQEILKLSWVQATWRLTLDGPKLL